MEYENVTQIVLFGNACFGFLKQTPLSKRNVFTELNMQKIHLQIILSDIG
jgi:hypothetical protein